MAYEALKTRIRCLHVQFVVVSDIRCWLVSGLNPRNNKSAIVCAVLQGNKRPAAIPSAKQLNPREQSINTILLLQLVRVTLCGCGTHTHLM